MLIVCVYRWVNGPLDFYSIHTVHHDSSGGWNKDDSCTYTSNIADLPFPL